VALRRWLARSVTSARAQQSGCGSRSCCLEGGRQRCHSTRCCPRAVRCPAWGGKGASGNTVGEAKHMLSWVEEGSWTCVCKRVRNGWGISSHQMAKCPAPPTPSPAVVPNWKKSLCTAPSSGRFQWYSSFLHHVAAWRGVMQQQQQQTGSCMLKLASSSWPHTPSEAVQHNSSPWHPQPLQAGTIPGVQLEHARLAIPIEPGPHVPRLGCKAAKHAAPCTHAQSRRCVGKSQG